MLDDGNGEKDVYELCCGEKSQREGWRIARLARPLSPIAALRGNWRGQLFVGLERQVCCLVVGCNENKGISCCMLLFAAAAAWCARVKCHRECRIQIIFWHDLAAPATG